MLEKINKDKTMLPLSIVVGALILAFSFILVSSQKTAKSSFAGVLSPEAAGEKTINYINENILAGASSAELIDISDTGSVYKIILKIEGVEFDSYISKDAKFLFPDGYNMEEALSSMLPQEEQTPGQEEQSPLSEEELKDFIGCLDKADFVIYGANWCGWTQGLISMLGGLEMVKPIYIECTQETALCQEKKISGYPTILIKDQDYKGERTFQGFSGVTGCQAPEGSQSLEQNLSGGC